MRMKITARILGSEGLPVTGFIEVELERQESGNSWHFTGEFDPPAGFSFAETLPGGLGMLETRSGKRYALALLLVTDEGRFAFHLPGVRVFAV